MWQPSRSAVFITQESLMRFQLTCAIAAMLLLAACDSPEEREAAYLKSGKELYESGELSKAAIEFRNALKINPTGVEAKYFTALIFEKKGNVPRAISAFQDVALQDPNNREVQLKLGQYALMNADAVQASDRADKLIALDSNKPDGHTMKAAALLMMNKLPEAETEANTALTLKPHDEDATIVLASQRARQKKFEQAEAIVEEALQANPTSVPLLGFKLKLLADQNRKTEVEQVLRQLIEFDPTNPGHVVLLANELTAAGRLPEAREEFRRAIAANKDSQILLAAYADFLEKHVGTDEAIDEAKQLAGYKATPSIPSCWHGFISRPTSWTEADAFKQLVEEFERSSDKLDAQVELARITMLRGDEQGALDQLATILKADSKNQSALTLRAGIRLKQGKFDESIADARAILSDAPTSTAALAILAKAYTATNEHELAIGALRNRRGRADNVEVRKQLAVCWSARARRGHSRRSRPDDAEMKALKAQILICTKRWDQGR
jgi:tetratricopeptide (TPR) repeat protein